MLVSASSHDRLTFWNDVYGFDMANMAGESRKDYQVELVPAESMLSAASVFRVVDCVAGSDADLDFTSEIEITITADGVLRCLVVHFDAVFDLGPGGNTTSFTTSYAGPPTHWKQTVLYLNATRAVAPGDVLKTRLGFSRDAAYKRSYNISAVCELNGQPLGVQQWQGK